MSPRSVSGRCNSALCFFHAGPRRSDPIAGSSHRAFLTQHVLKRSWRPAGDSLLDSSIKEETKAEGSTYVALAFVFSHLLVSTPSAPRTPQW